MPNVLILWTDEQAWDMLGCAGNAHLRTPHLDRLAAESTHFAHAYCASPVCTPSRGTVITGMWPKDHGAVANNVPLREDARSLAELLPDHRAGYVGKWHLGDEIFPQHGFEVFENVDDSYKGHYSPGRDRSARCPYHHWLVELGYAPDHPDGLFTRGFVAALPEEHSKPRWQADRAIGFIDAAGERPWLLSVNTLEPHMPFTGPRNEHYGPDALPVPPNFLVAPGEDRLLRTRVISRLQGRHGHAGFAIDEPSLRRCRANYHGLTEQVDAHFGRILDHLRATGAWDDTLIVFTSDHGDQMGSHALLAKTVMYEESARIPWLVKLPGQNEGRVVDAPVSHVDLVPTVLDAVGTGVPGHLPGRSIADACRGDTEPGRDVVLVWHRDEGADNGNRLGEEDAAALADLGTADEMESALRGEHRCLVTPDRWKLIASDAGERELYDLAADPYELANLAGDTTHADRLEDCERRLADWQRTVGDTMAPVDRMPPGD